MPTGFVLGTSVADEEDDFKFISRRSIYTNMRQNMTLVVHRKIWEDNSEEVDLPGILYRTYTFLDLAEINELQL